MLRNARARSRSTGRFVSFAGAMAIVLLASSACGSLGSPSGPTTSGTAAAITSSASTAPSNVPAAGPGAWTPATALGPQADSYPVDVECASATFCVAPVLGSPQEWMWDGHSWQGPLAGPDLLLLSCAPGPFCLGFSESGPNGSYVTTTDGVHWQSTPLPSGVGGFGLACASSTLCVSATQLQANFAASIFNGTSWSGPTTLVTTGQDPSSGNVVNVDSASCTHTGPAFCMVTAQVNGAQTAATYSNGSFSSPIAMGPNSKNTDESVSLTCPSSTFCLEWQGALTRWDGRSFSPVGGVAANAVEVGCASTAFCLATAKSLVGKPGGVYSYDGANWSAIAGPASLPVSGGENGPYVQPAAVNCPTVHFCAALFTEYESVSGPTAQSFVATYSH